MPKERTQKKEAKKKPTLTPKEKQAAKRSKKAGTLAISASGLHCTHRAREAR